MYYIYHKTSLYVLLNYIIYSCYEKKKIIFITNAKKKYCHIFFVNKCKIKRI